MIRVAPRPALAAVVAGALLVAGARVGRAADDLRTIPSRPGVTQSFLLVRPAARPTAAVVLFAGGNGALKLGTGRPGLGGNFLVRNRARFAEHGLLVAVVDAPSDRPDGLDGFRTTPYADTVALLRDLAGAPRRELLTFEGGASPQSGPCEPRAAHGYFGLDAEAVAAIAKWITTAARP